MHQDIITVVGGSGFLGTHAVRALARAGWRIQVICRRPDRALHLKTAGGVGQVALMAGDLNRPETIAPALKHSSAVLNLVGVLYEKGRQNFHLHAQGAEKLAQEARKAGVRRFIHVSALGVDRVKDSQYAMSKLAGERAVRATFPAAAILRPSVIFGPGDDFLNQFGRMAVKSPILPCIGGGVTKFQPVYAGDVAEAVLRCLTNSATQGEIYELGGAHVLTFRDILEYVLRVTGRKAWLAPIPFGMASLIGAFGEWLPRPPLTRDQVRLLRSDNVVRSNARGFAHLGITPTAMTSVAPDYLACYRRANAGEALA